MSAVLRTVGQAIKRLRRAKGLTQVTAAELLGVGRLYWQRIERGRQNMSLRTLAKVCAMLGVAPEDLFRSNGVP